MKKYLVLFIIIAITNINCSKELESKLFFNAFNKNAITIRILTKTNLEIANIASNKVARIYNPIIGDTSQLTPPLGDSAPLKVVFNEIDTVLHYNDSLSHQGKYLNKLSPRNLFYPQAYTTSKFTHGETGTTIERLYTFTIEDYEYAKE